MGVQAGERMDVLSSVGRHGCGRAEVGASWRRWRRPARPHPWHKGLAEAGTDFQHEYRGHQPDDSMDSGFADSCRRDSVAACISAGGHQGEVYPASAPQRG
jgi:hypothetical protein